MKTLIILRHAEAAEKPPGGSDFERTLTDKGRAQAARQGRFLAEGGFPIERVRASAALRAMETANAVTEAAGLGLAVEGVQELYNAPGEALLEFVRGQPDEFETLLLVAHVPGVAHLLSMLTTEHVDLDINPGWRLPHFPKPNLSLSVLTLTFDSQSIPTPA